MKNLVDKIVSRGADSLTNEELIAAIIAESSSDEGAIAVSRELLTKAGGVANLMETDFSRLRMMSGLGKMRAIRLKAAQELGSRVAVMKASSYDVILSDSDVARIMQPIIGGLQHEECWAIYLASSGRVLERMRISQGGVQATVVDCKLIIKRALELLAVQIVLVHNHPSGNIQPSKQDIALTERVSEAAQLFDIRLLDHVIIAKGAHYSFRGEGIIR
ncbi:MAG: DNA repair protein RadC [Alistipes sp.]|nr:DNA repair protein RadC [Alistipes sp.]